MIRVLIVGLALCSLGWARTRTWESGRILDERTSSTYLGTLSNGTANANVTATRVGNSVTATGGASSTASSIPIYRTDQVVIIDTAKYTYILSRRVWWDHASLTVNGPVWFAIEGASAYVVDDRGREFKAALFRRVLKIEPEARPSFQSPQGAAARGSDWHMWASVSGPDRFAVRRDGVRIYAEQVLAGGAWLKLEVQLSANIYVGAVHFGFVDPAGKSCSFDNQAEVTLIDESHVEGAMLTLPPGAAINTADCTSASRPQIRRFVWVPE